MIPAQFKGRPLKMVMGPQINCCYIKLIKLKFTQCLNVEMCTTLNSRAGIQILFWVDGSVSSKCFSGVAYVHLYGY